MRNNISVLSAIVLIFLSVLSAHAQENENEEATDIDEIVDAIVKLRDANDANDTIVIKQQAKVLKEYQIDDEIDYSDEYFNPRSPVHDDFSAIWDKALKESKDSVPESQSPEHIGTDLSRISGNSSTATTKRYRLKEGESIKHITRGINKLSVAAIPQADGLITMRIHASNRHGYNEHFDDKEKFHDGMNYRKRQISLPETPTKVEIEILNRTKHDITFLLVTK